MSGCKYPSLSDCALQRCLADPEMRVKPPGRVCTALGQLQGLGTSLAETVGGVGRCWFGGDGVGAVRGGAVCSRAVP